MIRVLHSESLAEKIVANVRKPLKSFWRELSRNAKYLKTGPIPSEEKNRLWAIQTFADGTVLYLDAYHLMARGKFYDGWCNLEKAELAFARLIENPFLKRIGPLTKDRAQLVALWQSLFPYRHFASPGMRYKKWACSICGVQSTPVEPCGHVVGRVYAGQLCYRIIYEAEPLEVSLVTDPVQKYSVLHLDYDYSVVQYVLDHLTSAFHLWDGEWTHKRHSHANFADRPHDGPCPCASKLRYVECCLLEEGVRLPHFQMVVRAGATKAGPPSDRLVLRSPSNQVALEGERTFQVNLLRSSL
ncbi:hypothetical protein ACQR0V_23585 [Bradyrhizobium sp. HKCCYLS2058]|uniref:hypothetical protein n=1 Tax=unclassified Bradyrhizobium TaxID=2631580 RepID=UPI003EBE14B0